jgi:hypothetical protein
MGTGTFYGTFYGMTLEAPHDRVDLTARRRRTCGLQWRAPNEAARRTGATTLRAAAGSWCAIEELARADRDIADRMAGEEVVQTLRQYRRVLCCHEMPGLGHREALSLREPVPGTLSSVVMRGSSCVQRRNPDILQSAQPRIVAEAMPGTAPMALRPPDSVTRFAGRPSGGWRSSWRRPRPCTHPAWSPRTRALLCCPVRRHRSRGRMRT